VFAVTLLVFMLSFQFGSYEDMINASVTLDTGHIQVMAPGYHDDSRIWKVINDPGAVLDKVQGLENVKAASMRMEAFCLASSEKRTKGVFIAGIDPKQEKKVSRLSDSMKEGHYLEPSD
jgi:ABC-type lipoprotein release transport system permease subunit